MISFLLYIVVVYRENFYRLGIDDDIFILYNKTVPNEEYTSFRE